MHGHLNVEVLTVLYKLCPKSNEIWIMSSRITTGDVVKNKLQYLITLETKSCSHSYQGLSMIIHSAETVMSPTVSPSETSDSYYAHTVQILTIV